MFEQLGSTTILYRFMAGGTAAVIIVGLVYRFMGPTAAGIAMAALLLAGLGGLIFNKGLKGLRKRKVSAFDKGLQADANKPTRGKVESRKAVAELAGRWNQAVTELKGAGLSFYDLPWYLLIGEPQSGKSTTLKNSSLEFPVGTEALSGAGGTRNCDWWFTNEAIILDTAGRFTFQEKNAPDAEEWNGFLRMLRKYRAACPINGVVLTIPCTSLLSDNEEEREEKARNIREKLTQIQRELGVQFPVFILITKSDQILGFTEFFSRLSATEQRQLLGWSMQGPFIQSYDPDSFGDVFQKLYERIHKWRNKLLGEDMSLTEIDKLYVFPEEFKSLREPLYDYLKTIFVKTHYLPPLFLRGFYFTSGLQQGRPIARACAQLIRSAGAGGEEIIEHLQKIFERSRAFFIRDFYLEKLFPERNLVIHSEEKMKIGRKLGHVAIWGSALVMALTIAFVAWQGVRATRGIGGIEKVAAQVRNGFVKEVDRTGEGAADPLGAEQAADAVKLSAEFGRAARQTAQRLSVLAPYLRDMHWMYFIGNCLQDQGRALYAKLAASPAGASVTDAALGKQYAAYTHLWSLNVNWLDHTRGDRGAFGEAGKIEWPAMTQAGITDETRKLFQDELALVRKELADPDLDFRNLPIALPFIPGEADPTRNKPISKEVEAIRTGFKPADTATVQSVVGAARTLRDGYGQAAAGLLGVPCGYAAADTDPFTGARASITAVRGQLTGLDTVLGTNKDLLRSLAADLPSVQKAFDQLTWAKAAVPGPAQQALDKYILAAVKDTSERLAGQAEVARLPLREVSDVIITSGTLTRNPALGIVAEGLGRIEALADAQNAVIKQIAAHPIRNPDEAKQAAEQWKLNEARVAALKWAADNATRADLAPAWQVVQIAQATTRMVEEGDESVLVEAWLAYIRTAGPGPLLSGSQVEAASLKEDPPGGARPENVLRAQDTLNALLAELGKFREGIKCQRSVDRLRQQSDNLSAVIKKNQANFVAYWQTAWQRWDPSAWIQGISTWEAFKSDPLIQGPQLAQRIRGELQRLVVNVQGFKDKGGSIGELAPVLADLAQYATPNSVLEQNANLFNDTVGEMAADKLTAAVQLEQAGTNGQPRMRSLEAIATRSSSLNPKFDYYPKKVRSLLEARAEFETELGRFLTRWSRDLAGRFPFAPDRSRIKFAGNTVQVPQAGTRMLADFYYGAESLPTFLEKYKALYEVWVTQPGNAPLRDFVSACLKQRDFFFDPAGGGKYR
ncbi:MAG: hypothetical protein M1457_06120, partial [bacterium]|nr:hypothetical protein [bacterium]